MILEVLICTSNDRIYSIEKNIPIHPNVKYLISHQIYNEKHYDKKIFSRSDIKYKQIFSKGLSKNRNFALIHASGDICLIADDDVIYHKKFFNEILKAFKENKQADIITFKVRSPNNEPTFKLYLKKASWHDIGSIFRVSSIEIAFRRQKVQTAILMFDEYFGLNSFFRSGEENIFLMNAMKKGLRIKYIPKIVAIHPYERTETLDLFEKREIIKTGGLYYRIFGNLAILINFFSALANFKKYKTKYSLFQYLRLLLFGVILAKRLYPNIPIPFRTILQNFPYSKLFR